MNKVLLLKSRKVSLIIAFLMISLLGFAQVSYKNGIRKGMVKVKFTPAMSATVSQMKVSKRAGVLSTGIRTFDAVAQQSKASNIYRLFDYDPKYEAKLRKHGLDLWYVVEVDTTGDPESIAKQFGSLAEIAIAEVEHQKILAPFTVNKYTPGASTSDVLPFNDPLLKDQWHYKNSGQLGVGDADINLFEAWKKTSGASNIIVAVHDQGVDVKHEDLKDNMWINQAEFNGTPKVDDDQNGYVDDIYGYNFALRRGAIDPGYHGTHVAGTIAAVNNNGKGVSGIAGGNGSGNGVKIMSLQIFGGDALYEKTYIYAANNGAVISQNSWGYTGPGAFDNSLQDAIDYFVEEAGDYPGSPMKGGIVIFAAGNYGSDEEWYPGYYHKTLSVASIGPEWKKTGYSNYGTWVDISAPGGDTDGYGARGGVLSTIPNNEYAYLEGTSMACPHVSGIAALALANRTRQLTADGLWNILVTGVKDINDLNPDYAGKLGSGAIDASLVTRTDQSIPPAAVSNLTVSDIAQDLAILSWTVPADEDDLQPLSFELCFSTQPITSANIAAANKIPLKNKKAAGEEYSYELNDLLPLTTYYFAVRSTDRWGNISEISNIATATTNNGPAISVDENSQSVELEIDATVSTSATHEVIVSNQDAGLLRWKYFMRHKEATLSTSSVQLKYPAPGIMNGKQIIGRRNVNPSRNQVRSSDPAISAFTPVNMEFCSWPTNIVGETDIRLTNSAAGRFYVTEDNGFNLTNVTLYLKHDPAYGPVIIEIHKGTQLPNKNNLVLAQEYYSWTSDEGWANITLNEQLFFEKGETFWVVYHVPAGNLFPLGIGYESSEEASKNCFISFNMGSAWESLEEALGSKDFAYVMIAKSSQEYLGTYISLSPDSGDIAAYDQDTTVLTVDASSLSNGSYSANVVLSSNDANQPELRIPVSLNISGHKPHLKSIDIIDIGSVFKGKSKTIELLLENEGFGNYTVTDFSIDNGQFTFPQGTPWQVKARSQETVKIQFTPTQTGNINGLLHISNGELDYEIPLFGAGIETSVISVTPSTQVKSGLAIGDQVQAQITVSNTGKFPLKYFIPGFDTKGVSNNWPETYHKYGYKIRSNNPSESNPLPYEFQDISTTGVNITSAIKSDFKYYTLNLGFDFPYYNRVMHTIYIANKGFTTFDNSVNPINVPNLNDPWSPKGYISPLGTWLNYEFTNGQVYYQLEPDRVIIQYNEVGDGYSGTITAQMVIHSNGNIRFYYDQMGYDSYSQSGLTICMEDYDQSDGIMLNSWRKQIELFSGFALGFDYPGPDIITNLTNGSGTIMPGQSSVVDITMVTDSLVEGTTNRYLNIISNDPMNAQTNPLIQLEISSGGHALPVLSTDTILFGEVLRGANLSKLITIKNRGTANSVISSLHWIENEFLSEGITPSTIKPGLFTTYKITVPTSVLASLEDWLVISYSDGSHDTVYVSATVVPAPDIEADNTLLQATLNRGEISEQAFSIKNTGAGVLEVSTAGKHWLSFETETMPASVSYTFEKNNTGGVYQWTDLYETGATHLPLATDLTDNSQFFKSVALPFTFKFYGKEYDSVKIGENGVVSLDPNPQMNFFTDSIPSTMYPGPAIMPCWSFGGFDPYNYNPDEIGIFYQADTNKVIIEWRYILDNFGMGDPFSFQLMLFPNGSMKFLYKPEFGKLDAITGFGAVGLQENSSNGLMINDHQALDHGTGLVFTVVPVKNFLVNPGETINGKLVLDAREVFAGIHTGDLKIFSNVPGKETISKPVELTVNGSVSIEMPDTVDFGTKVAYYDEYQVHTYTSEMVLVNDGETPVDITYISMSDESQPLAMMLYVEGNSWFPGYWDYVYNIFSPWAMETPVYKLMPGDKLQARVAFYPETAGAYSNNVLLTTSAGEMSFMLIGEAVAPPALEADQTPVEVTMIQPTETDNRSIAFNNFAGGSDLDYHIGIEYFRVSAATSTTGKFVPGDSSALLKAVPCKAKKGMQPGNKGSYNRSIRYSEKNEPEQFLGTGGVAPFSLATKFNAGLQSFNLSHVETWFKPEMLESGTIKAEIRAGGSNIAFSQVLAEGTADFTNPDEDNTGYWLTIELNNPAFIYPGEDFYVVITYPLGISYPQGCDSKVEQVPGRYLYADDGAWYDLQEVYTFMHYGWMMIAHETTAVNDSWLTVSSDTAGILATGQESSISLDFNGTFAQRGTQRANIVISSNDPYHAEVKVPVVLNLNDAPRFYNIPEEIVVMENAVRTIKVDVVDVEGNSFTVTCKEDYSGVSWTFEDGILSVTFAPDYGSEGDHSYIFVAEDEHGAVREQAINIHVGYSNQAPVYIGADTAFQFHKLQSLNEFSVSELFADPDGDEFTFSVVNENPELLKVFTSQEGILVKTMAIGSTNLVFTLTDSKGAESVVSRTVTIDNTSGLGMQKEVNVVTYPNPTAGMVKVIRTGDMSGNGEIRVNSVLGETLMVVRAADAEPATELDLRSFPKGTYFIEVITENGRYTSKLIRE
ncbi:MAG: S8 family serine peptidase [Bacteroidales bacterium]